MKLALITDDGSSISRHFGRAAFYLVVNIEHGKIISQQLVPKVGHKQFSREKGHEHHHQDGASPQQHGFGPDANDRHARMFTPIADCEAVISGGMGAGAYQFLQSQGLQPILTEIESIPAAVEAYLAGRIENRFDWLH